ncbi:hypothetical protein BH20GEM1_BH20GEM1_19870 [soil metagenome]
MADPKRGNDTSEKDSPRRQDEGTRRETERKGETNPLPPEKGDTRTGQESRKM